jgi:DsbC/DsbD-like thiol-disulfide interchange protein
MALPNAARLTAGLLGLAGLVWAWGTFASPARAVAKSDSVVKVSATAPKPDADGKQVVTITLEMDKGWHTYANPVGSKDLEDSATTVTVTGKNKPQKVTIDYPKGTPFKDKAFGTFYIYEDKAVIKATVYRAKGDNGPLEVSVSINACNDKSCLQPATVKRTIK